MGEAPILRVLALFFGVLLVVAAVMVVNTLRYGSRQLRVTPVEIEVPATIADRLAGAVRFKTISHQQSERFDAQAFLALHDFLKRAYPNIGRILVREVVNDFSLLYTWKGTDEKLKPILLAAHLDVVPADGDEDRNWIQPPFAGRMVDGYIWGRGSMDDKVAVLGILEAAELLLATGFQPQRTVYLAFGHDEEVGGGQGAAKIAELLKSRGVRLAFLVDEGMTITHGLMPGVENPVAMVGIAEKGRVILELTATSSGGHASMPSRRTAVGALSRALQRLEANPMPAAITAPVRELFAHVGPSMRFDRRVFLANLWLFEPLIKRQLARSAATNAAIRTTLAVTMLSAGTKDNVLPTEAKALVNARVLPGDTTAAVVEHVRRVIDDPRVAVALVRAAEPSEISAADSVHFRTLAASIREIFPEVLVAPGLAVVRTDSQHYLSLSDAVYRFRPLRLTPRDISRIHGVNERVAIGNYAEIVKFYVQLLRNSTS